MWQDGLTRKAVKLVLAGDVTALRLCLDGDGSHNYALFISMMLDWTAALLALLRAVEIGDSLWIKHLGVSAGKKCVRLVSVKRVFYE